jgi:hypothetical protein
VAQNLELVASTAAATWLKPDKYPSFIVNREDLDHSRRTQIRLLALKALQSAIAENGDSPDRFDIRHIRPTDDLGVRSLNQWVFDLSSVSANTSDWKTMFDVNPVPIDKYFVIYGVRILSTGVISEIRIRDASAVHMLVNVDSLQTEFRDTTGYFTRFSVAKPQSRWIAEAIVASAASNARILFLGFTARRKENLEYQGQISPATKMAFGFY